jgi:hypothetical protein
MASILVYPGKGMMNDVEHYYNRNRVFCPRFLRSMPLFLLDNERMHSTYKCRGGVDEDNCSFTIYIKEVVEGVNNTKLK